MTQSNDVDIVIERGTEEVRLTITGDIDLGGVAALERARAKALDGHPESLLIDLRGVNFVDSSGLRFLLQTERAARSRGCTLRLLRPAGSAMQVFVVTGAERHLPFVDDETA
ncbi:MAG: STAS domain-containing protein [Solirubrobacteraceae bacterium]